jgi:hypothetical protein
MNIEEAYPILINDVLKYIDRTKEAGSDVPLIDIILDYSVKNDLSPELVGDAIMSDVYFKSFVEKDCEVHNMMKKGQSVNLDW